MDCWKILGLDGPSSDLRAIKKGYASQLKTTNPEDDPAGFQQLREAFEEAKMLAKYADDEPSIRYSDPTEPDISEFNITEFEPFSDSTVDIESLLFSDSPEPSTPTPLESQATAYNPAADVENVLSAAENESTENAIQLLDLLLDDELLSLDKHEQFTNHLLATVAEQSGPSIYDETFYEETASRLGIDLQADPHYSDSLQLWAQRRFALRAEIARLEVIMLNQQLKNISVADQKALAVLLGQAPLNTVIKRPKSNLREENALSVQLENLFIAAPDAAPELLSEELLNWAEEHNIPELAARQAAKAKVVDPDKVEKDSKAIGWLVFFVVIIAVKVMNYVNETPSSPPPTPDLNKLFAPGSDNWNELQRKLRDGDYALSKELRHLAATRTFQPTHYSVTNHDACLRQLDQFFDERRDTTALAASETSRRSDEICGYLHQKNEPLQSAAPNTPTYNARFNFPRCGRPGPPLYCNPIISKNHMRFTDGLKRAFGRCVDNFGLAKTLEPKGKPAGDESAGVTMSIRLDCQKISERLLAANKTGDNLLIGELGK